MFFCITKNLNKMKKIVHNAFIIIFSLIILVPKAYSQDIGATFCWHYKEIDGGHDYHHNASITKKYLGSATNWSNNIEWWENMVEEVEYSGIDFIAFLSRGNQPNAKDRGNGNPNHIPKFVDAMNSRGIDSYKLSIFDDCPNSWTGSKNWNESLGVTYSTDNPKFDCAVAENYKYIWDYNLKQAIGHIPDAMRYKIDGRMVIWFWSAKPSWMINLQGNLSKILTHIKTQCQAEYGFTPYLIIDKSWLDNDNTITTAHADGVHGWFSSANKISYTLWKKADGTWWNGQKFGCAVPGFSTPDEPSVFLDPSMGTDDNGKRLIMGLDNTVGAGARSTLVEGFTDAAEAAALWRSTDEGEHLYYNYANQRLNILRRYTSNPYPNTLKLEAEACDFYSDLTIGNSGGAFLYQGDLDVVKSSDTNGGWNVINTQADEWIEWKEIPLLYHTKFLLRYKSTEISEVVISVDEADLSVVSLPSTNNSWSTIDLGNKMLASNSLHNVKLKIISGSPDINYVNRVSDIGNSIEELDLSKSQFNMYPNPLNQNLLTIDLMDSEDLSNVEIRITDLLGKTVYTNTLHNTKNISIETNGILTKSIYLVTVKSGKLIRTTKLIVR